MIYTSGIDIKCLLIIIILHVNLSMICTSNHATLSQKKYATLINDVTKYKIELPKLRYGIPVQSTLLF